MKFAVITLFPDLFTEFSKLGVVGQAIQAGTVNLRTVNPRDFSNDRHKTVDDRPYGGGDGMVMMSEPLTKAVKSVLSENSHVVYLSAQGDVFNHKLAKEFSQKKDLVFICGRYGGIDERFINSYVDQEISIGDYVLSGGELAAQVIIDSVSRYQEGVLGNQKSHQSDSFEDGLLEGPLFTRPPEFEGQKVPEILLSGHHENIQKWRRMISVLKTRIHRPDLFEKKAINPKDLAETERLWEKLSDEEKKLFGLIRKD